MQEVEYQFWTRQAERRGRAGSQPVRIRGAIPRFSMAFQPIVNVITGEPYGFEALVRSSTGDSASSVLTRVPDANFHLFDKACRSYAMQLSVSCGLLERPGQRLCVNVNPKAAMHQSTSLRLTCDEAVTLGFPLERLVLELVEDAEIVDVDDLKQMVEEYRSCGVQVAMDDFGAGYSGLKLLSMLHPDVVKVDMSLVDRIHVHRPSAIIVKAIVEVCFELGIVVIAEGVERYETAVQLRDMGVLYQQGYYFAKPAFEQLPRLDFRLPEVEVGAMQRLTA